jgi:hypothetical protein
MPTRQATLLLGAAGLTLVVLLAGYLGFRAITGPSAEVASAIPSASAGTVRPVASASVRVSAAASASASASVVAPSATAIPSPTPFRTAGPTPVPGETVTYTRKGTAYVDSVVPTGGAITTLAGGAIKMTTGTANSDELTVTYRLTLPAGRLVKSYQVKVCGSGSGNFWEAYGPPGAIPAEYEVVPPASDGCWNFKGSSMTDTTVLAIIGFGSTMRIDRIDYILTFR